MKVIVENQKKGSPQLIVDKPNKDDKQLQTEILDSLAGLFGKLLTATFKGTINLIKYLVGVGVNVYYGEQYAKGKKYPVTKNNPLAPLSILKATLTGLPENYQNIFKSIYSGISGKGEAEDELKKDTGDTVPGEGAGSVTDMVTKLDKSVEESLVFDSVEGIKYPIKFEFSNLKTNDKKNATVMMSTWNLIFNVESDGKKASEGSTLTFNLVGFPASGPSLARLFAAGKSGKEKETEFLTKALQKFETEVGNTISLIFSNTGQSVKFGGAMKKQISTHMKVMIAEVNKKLGTTNLIKVPTVIVNVDPGLIGTDLEKGVNPQDKKNQVDIDIQTLSNMIKDYQKYVALNPKDTNAKDFLKTLEIKIKGLLLIKKDLEGRIKK